VNSPDKPGLSVGRRYSIDEIKDEMAQAAAPRGEKAVNKVNKPAARSGARRGMRLRKALNND
jgi:hypothetical protein